jgi:hypothetical protein
VGQRVLPCIQAYTLFSKIEGNLQNRCNVYVRKALDDSFYTNDLIQSIPITMPPNTGTYKLTYPRQVCHATFFLSFSALECGTVVQSYFVFHTEQSLTVYEKCILVKEED